MRKAIAFTPLVLILLATVSQANNPNVYLVKAFNCQFEPKARTLTGFRARGLKGIVTALHGVADSGKIMVQNNTGHVFSQQLRIVKVDVDRDLALLSSDEIEAEPAEGFEIAQNVNWNQLRGLTLIGHPYGINGKSEEPLQLRVPPLQDLHDIVPPGPLLRLVNRSSPSTDMPVVWLRGGILPGCSGAPILDSQDRVVAVANGGLAGGATEMVWAIPWQDVNWQPPSEAPRFQQVASAAPDVLFSFNPDTPANSEATPVFPVDKNIPPRFPIMAVRDDSLEKGKMKTEVTILSDGSLSSTTTTESTGILGFCGKVSIWLLDKDNKVLSREGEGTQWCVDGKGVPFVGPSHRTDKLGIFISQEVRNKTYSVAILHTPGSKNPVALIEENIKNALQVMKPVDQ